MSPRGIYAQKLVVLQRSRAPKPLPQVLPPTPAPVRLEPPRKLAGATTFPEPHSPDPPIPLAAGFSLDPSPLWNQIQARLAMVHWLEVGFLRLREYRHDRQSSPLAREAERAALDELIDLVAETMLECDELQEHARRMRDSLGRSNWDPGAPVVTAITCAMARSYKELEARFRFYLALSRDDEVVGRALEQEEA
jgi:hypothetical protein